jgi:Flp pilus assembly protein TadG
MTAMRKCTRRFKDFLRDEDGLILVEGLIMMPLIIWALVAMFIYWDVFRTINVTQKAAYSVADLLSRQRDTIPLTFANGLQNVAEFLTPGGHPVKMRITSFECVSTTTGVCNSTSGTYRLLFSFSPRGKVATLTQANIQAWKTTRVPVMNNGESVFVVETSVEFKTQMKTVLAGFLVGVDDGNYGQFIVTRPRHRRLCLEGTTTCT